MRTEVVNLSTARLLESLAGRQGHTGADQRGGAPQRDGCAAERQHLRAGRHAGARPTRDTSVKPWSTRSKSCAPGGKPREWPRAHEQQVHKRPYDREVVSSSNSPDLARVSCWSMGKLTAAQARQDRPLAHTPAEKPDERACCECEARGSATPSEFWPPSPCPCLALSLLPKLMALNFNSSQGLRHADSPPNCACTGISNGCANEA